MTPMPFENGLSNKNPTFFKTPLREGPRRLVPDRVWKWKSYSSDSLAPRTYFLNRCDVNWKAVDLLFEKHLDWTPYNYVLGNPLRLVDPSFILP